MDDPYFSCMMYSDHLRLHKCILEEDVGKSVEKIDEQRRKTLAYEYLCYLEGAKK